MILLDTCALLWLAGDHSQLTKNILTKINDEPVIYLSAISGFEISLKYLSKKLSLPVPAKDWLKSIIKHHDISIIDLDLDICVKATELPPIHKDPCDRLIIATALVNKFQIVTKDTRFEDYGVEVLY